ncbi:hypothetical protein PVAP13_2KG271880 [Panicum virgatum]|uniref:Uncharacterized protein n=1 Tax=Panicum virgatum TaxID=38727 RepID=A0A8T0WH37_PANVG|nr:hypothetical protein PVAP13_2KG271880 [Panicum virgatum]
MSPLSSSSSLLSPHAVRSVASEPPPSPTLSGVPPPCSPSPGDPPPCPASSPGRRRPARPLLLSSRTSAMPRLLTRVRPPPSLHPAPPPRPGEAAAVPPRCPAFSPGQHRRRCPRRQRRLLNPLLTCLLLHAAAQIHHLHAGIHQCGDRRRRGWSGRGKGAGASANDGAGRRSRTNPPPGRLWSDPPPAAGRNRWQGSRGGETGRRAVADRRWGRRARGRGRRPAAGEEGEGHGAAVGHAWLTFRSLANTCPRIPVC